MSIDEGRVCNREVTCIWQEAVSDGRSSVVTSLVELVVKSCVELLHSSGINIPVVFRHPCVLFRQQTTYHFKTSNS